MSEYVKITTINGIGTIEFYHPQSNSLPGNILAKLATTITDAGNDKNIKVIILKSAGERAFCAGASFDELIAIDNPEQGKKFFLGFANVINAARKCPKFILGRVQGKAVGGGVGMAAATDYCFATKYSSIYYPVTSVIHISNNEHNRSLKLFYYALRATILYFNKWGYFDEERSVINKKVYANIIKYDN